MINLPKNTHQNVRDKEIFHLIGILEKEKCRSMLRTVAYNRREISFN